MGRVTRHSGRPPERHRFTIRGEWGCGDRGGGRHPRGNGGKIGRGQRVDLPQTPTHGVE